MDERVCSLGGLFGETLFTPYPFHSLSFSLLIHSTPYPFHPLPFSLFIHLIPYPFHFLLFSSLTISPSTPYYPSAPYPSTPDPSTPRPSMLEIVVGVLVSRF